MSRHFFIFEGSVVSSLLFTFAPSVCTPYVLIFTITHPKVICFLNFFGAHFGFVVGKVEFVTFFAICNQFSCQSVTGMSRRFFISVGSIEKLFLFVFAPSVYIP